MPHQKAACRTFVSGRERGRSIARTAAGDCALNWRAVCSISSFIVPASAPRRGEKAHSRFFQASGGDGCFASFASKHPLSQEVFTPTLLKLYSDFTRLLNAKQEGETW